MALSLEDKSKLVSSFWNDLPSPCPKHDVPMRSFFVDRVYKPQVVMVCPKGELFRFDQKPKQIEFSRGHLKTMVLDAQEREFPAFPTAGGATRVARRKTSKRSRSRRKRRPLFMTRPFRSRSAWKWPRTGT